VLFLPEFPLTATGKIQRFRLREHALSVLSAPAAPGAAETAGAAGVASPAPAGQG
jgi:hypothetical protein